MKIALLLVLFSSSVIGVFADEVKSVSVMEGDSVTLHTGVTIIQGSDSIEWRCNGTRMAKIKSDSTRTDESFRDSMQLNSQTGDLRITNIRPTDSGLYKLIKKGRDLSEMTFSVTVISGVKSVSVTEGDSFTLNSGLTEIQRDDEIRWSFKNNSIADQRFSTYDDDLDERFRGRLKLDHQTGSLTIMNTRNTDDGEYGVEISTNRFTIHKRISVTVNDEVKSVSVTEGDSVTLNSGLTEIQRDDVIRWSFGKTIIAEIIKADQPFPTDDGPDGRFKDRLKLDHQTGSLTITNTRITDSGVYKVEISTNRFIIHKRISVTIDETVTLKLVKEGDSVTLPIDAPIPRNHEVLWYGDKNIFITRLLGSNARWKNTVQNDRTGDLTIRNIQRYQSGDYKVIFMDKQTFFTSIHRKFHINITGVFSDETDEVKKVSVMKGDSFFLNTSVTEIQNGDLIEWLFEPQNISIALMEKTDGKSKITYNYKDVRFKNRLNLDNQTGDLTIKNSNSEDSGRYQLKIINNNTTYTIQKSFSVTVNSDLSSVVPDSGQSSAVPGSCLSPGAVVGIVIAVIAVLGVVAAAVGVIYYCLGSSKPERSSEVNGQNHTSDKDEETELTKPAQAVEQQ